VRKCAEFILGLALLLCWAPLGYAQTEEAGEGQVTVTDPAVEQPADQPAGEGAGNLPSAGRGRARQGMDGRRGALAQGRNAALLGAMRDEVKRTLHPDEESAAEIDAIFQEHIDALQKVAEDTADERRARAEEIRSLVSELREAQRDGDTERVAQLRDRITELRRNEDEGRVAFDELAEQMHEVLTDEQFTQYEQIARKYEARMAGRQQPSERALQRIRQALAVVNLSPEQRQTTRTILIEATREIRSARDDERKAMELVDALREDVANELDDQQLEAFDKAIAEAEKRDKVMDPNRGAAEPGHAPAHDGAEHGDEAGQVPDDEQGAEHAAEAGGVDHDPYDDPQPPE